MKLGGVRLGPTKIVAGLIGVLAAVAVWPLSVWLGTEVVLVGVMFVAVLGVLLAGLSRRDAARRVTVLENRLRGADERIAYLHEARDELRQRQAAEQSRMDQRVRQLERPFRSLDELQRRTADLQRHVGDVASELRDLRSGASADRRRLHDLDQALDAVGRHAAEVEDLHAAATASLEELWAAFDALPGAADVRVGDELRLKRIRRSGLFDEDFYREQHADELGGTDPLAHYLEAGWQRGYAPSPLIDVADLSRRLLARGREPVQLFLAREEAGLLPRPHDPPVALRADEPQADLELRWNYLLDGGHRHEHTFVLTRIIGNDLPPRHAVGQSLDNLRFVLEHEPDLPGCERRFVLNRILDPDDEAALIRLLEKHDVPYTRIPFVWDDYRRIGWRFGDFPEPGFVHGPRARERPEPSQGWVLDHAYHDKNLYAMNNNGARNVALDDGRERARWVLPWDGNGFVTATAWKQITGAIRRRPHLPYVLVPMVRVTTNDDVLDPAFAPEAAEEPQIVFRADARERFDPDRRYGRRPKAELFQRLGVPGMWDNWVIDPWEPPIARAPERGRFHQAGYVVRLSSGRPDLETNAGERGYWRLVTILQRIDELDRRAAEDRFTPDAGMLLPDRQASAAPLPRVEETSGEPRTPAVLATDLAVLTVAAARDPETSRLQAIDERLGEILQSVSDTDAADATDAPLSGAAGAAGVDSPRQPVTDASGAALPAGWAAVVLDAGVLLRRLDRLAPTTGEALRELAERARTSAGRTGPYGVVGYDDAPGTVWELLDQLAGQAFLGDLAGVLATARCVEDLAATRARTIRVMTGNNAWTATTHSGPIDPVTPVEVEQVGWALLARAIARLVPDDAAGTDRNADRGAARADRDAAGADGEPAVVIDDRAALAAVRVVLRRMR